MPRKNDAPTPASVKLRVVQPEDDLHQRVIDAYVRARREANLRRGRNRDDYTDAELAEYIDRRVGGHMEGRPFHRATIGRWKAGTADMRVVDLLAMAELAGMTPEMLGILFTRTTEDVMNDDQT